MCRGQTGRKSYKASNGDDLLGNVKREKRMAR
jgi:hypothetical protein